MFFTFTSTALPEQAKLLRREIRSWLQSQGTKTEWGIDAWLGGFSPAFSQELGMVGYIGMTWPRAYGGQERSQLERYVVLEELLAAGAPVAAHWVAERQMGPLILRYGTEEQKARFLPPIAAGRSFWAIGMSEPNAGSDLASVASKIVRDGAGWRLSGQKIWTSGAHYSQYMMTLVRHESGGGDRHAGLTNVIVDLKDPAVQIRPIRLINGEHHFNEVFFHDVWIPEEMVLGAIGDGWQQVTEELAYERSGPERFLSTFPLLSRLVDLVREADPDAYVREVVPLISDLITIRELSLAVAVILSEGGNPVAEAALVKDMGTRFERKVTEVAEKVLPVVPLMDGEGTSGLLAQSVLHGPGFTIRGGTNEILRGIIAKELIRHGSE